MPPSVPLGKTYRPSPAIARCLNAQTTFRLLIGPRGEGKCLAPGTPVIMADGSRRPVEYVYHGDQVMGMDSQPRTVIGLHHGFTEMLEIVPTKGEAFTVTHDHLVTLKRTITRTTKRGKPFHDRLAGELIEMKAEDLQHQSKTFFNTYRLLRVGVDFPGRPVPIDPYFIGLWLGDGHVRSLNITTADVEIVAYLKALADVWDLHLACTLQEKNLSSVYRLSRRPAYPHSVPNHLLDAMITLGLLKTNGDLHPGVKRIPLTYLYNSREVRLQVLAGLLDSDGWTNHGGYQIIQKREDLADDIVYLARSLGFAAYKAKRTKFIRSRAFTGLYHWVGISGNCAEIPVKLPHKRVAPRVQGWKDHMVTGVKAVREAGYGEYYGFQLDGDGRFLLGDFTVTHNTTGALMTIYTYALQQPAHRWPLIVACVRDTRTNIGITTAPSIKEWWPEGLASTWTGKAFAPEVAEIQHDSGATLLRFHFFGCDSTSDMNRFQSFECDVLYVEEPAPAAGVSGGISGDVVGVAITSQRRESLALVVVASNPPDGEHWVAQVWGLPGAVDAEWDEERRQAIQWIRQRSTIVRLAPGDNTILTQRQPEYRERNREVLTAFGRTDLVNRLVEGEVGTVQEGEKVASGFTPAHIVDVCPVLPVGARVVMSWDPRQHPCCILWYVRPGGLCWVLAAWQGMNRGVRQLITQAIKPWLALHVGHSEYTIVHTGDPNTLTEDQSDSAVTATKVILSLLGGVQWVPGPVGIEERRLPMHDCLNLYVQGRPWVQISREHCGVLIKALEGGWYYPKDAAGRVIKEKWAKNASSDVGEAFAYGCSFLQRQKGETSTMERWRQKLSQQARQRQRGGWAGTGA